jgi:hypothetical protein
VRGQASPNCLPARHLLTSDYLVAEVERWNGKGRLPVQSLQSHLLPVYSLPASVVLIFCTSLVLLDDLPGGLLHGFINQVLSFDRSYLLAGPCRREDCYCLCISQGMETPMFVYTDNHLLEIHRF